jgi:hypothetical protein
MDEAFDGRNQADQLVKRFQRTGLTPPTTEWQPTPTAGDYVRSVSSELVPDETAVQSATETTKALWG